MAETSPENPFVLLGVGPETADEDVKDAWRQAAFRLHPDRNPGDPDAQENFARAKDAFDLLKTADLRREAARTYGVAAAEPARPFYRSAFDAFYRAVDVGAAPWAKTQSGMQPKRGGDIRRVMTLSLEQAFRGGRFAIEHMSAVCGPCNGSGRIPWPQTVLCPQCLGDRAFRKSNGVTRITSACPTCTGRGRVPWIVCEDCGGTGQLPAISADIPVPAGAANGEEVTVAGLGAPGIGGGSAGDLVVRIHVLEMPAFGRDGADLLHRITIPVWDAALGCRRAVKGIDGQRREFDIPPGCRSGHVITLPGAGMPEGPKRGDLRIRIEVQVPDAGASGPLREMFVRMKTEMDRR